RAPELGEVVHDALDHAHLIARDTVALGRLEVDEVIEKAKGEARVALESAKHQGRRLAARARVEGEDWLVRLAFPAIPTTVGTAGAVFLAVAVFLGLGYLIPSLAARFFVFAVVFLIVAAFAAAKTARRSVSRRRLAPNERLRHLAPMHPPDGNA